MTKIAILDRMNSTADAIRSVVEVHPLASNEDEASAKELLRIVRTLMAGAEDERKALKRPHLDAGRAIDERFREPRQGLERVERLLKQRLAERVEARDRAQRDAIESARLAADAGRHREANEALARVPGPEPAPVKGVSERWTYEVESADLRAVPIAYLSLDMVRVRHLVREAVRQGIAPSLPGIEFTRKAVIVARKIS